MLCDTGADMRAMHRVRWLAPDLQDLRDPGGAQLFLCGMLRAREGGDEEDHFPAHVLYLTWRSNGFDPTLDSPSNHSKFLCLRTGAE